MLTFSATATHGDLHLNTSLTIVFPVLVTGIHLSAGLRSVRMAGFRK